MTIPTRRRLPSGRRSVNRAVALTAFLLTAVPVPAMAAYRLDVGDVVGISVFGVPELQTRAKIDVDGDISFPLIGTIKIAGSTVEEVRDKLRKLLGDEVLLHAPVKDGNNTGRIGASEIMIEIAEYRPVYVIGAVAKPGERPFRPGLTVRQAIALAGGSGVSKNITRPVISVFRKVDQRATRIAAADETPLSPGDVVEVTVEAVASRVSQPQWPIHRERGAW